MLCLFVLINILILIFDRWSLADGSPIPSDADVRETHAVYFSNLMFTDIRAVHAGAYTCRGANAADTTSVTAVMRVKGNIQLHYIFDLFNHHY